MLVSNQEQVLYLGRRKVDKDDDDGNRRSFYFVNVADETGDSLTFFADKNVYSQCDILTLAMPVLVSLDISSRQRGVGCGIRDIRPA